MEGLLLGHGLGAAERGEDRLHRERAVLGDARGDLLRLRQRLTVGHDVIDEPELVGSAGGEILTREQHLGGDGVGDLAAQPNRRSGHRE